MRRRPFMLLLAGLVILLGVWAWRLSRDNRNQASPIPGTNLPDPAVVRQFVQLEARERELDETLWAPERLAERHSLVLDQLWDALNATTNKLAVLAAFPVPALQVPQWGAPDSFPHGIQRQRPLGAGVTWPASAWPRFLSQLESAGWQLENVEFRHNQFDPPAPPRPAHSRFWTSANLIRPTTGERGSLRGNLDIQWSEAPDPETLPAVARIDATALEWCIHRGPPAFTLVCDDRVAPPDHSFFIDPLLVEDLDGDGLPELALASANRCYSRQADGRFAWRPLCETSPGLLFTAVLADFDGDGRLDLLGARFDGLVLFRGSEGGRFPGPAEVAWAANPRLKYGQVLSCGDVDHDGDLDVWLAQYKGPYTAGQMPTPYFDANDGHPAWLLLNDGHGRFHDATAPAGLQDKRTRRTYSSSLADLDGDGDLDLVVISDFAGADAYQNDGHGRFEDRTAEWLPARHLFGMAHTFADFNGDGRLDLLAMGMHCPTAQRLDHLRLVRPGFEAQDAMRPASAAGNRLWAGRSQGGFASTPLNESIAHSGWSWGCTTLDWDNDGWADVFIANGHESKQSVRDYEPDFWLHDIYVANSRDNLVANAFFLAEAGRTRSRGWSYGGYEKNRLFWNQGGTNFMEIGHQLGLALEADSRNAVAADFDGDGRMDLAVTTFEVWPEVRQTLKIYRNSLPDAGSWAGVRLRTAPGAPGPIGATVRLLDGGAGSRVRPLVTGDSFRSQHPATAHFGLGTNLPSGRIRVDWPDGSATETLVAPAPRYLEMQAVPPGRRD